MSRTKNRKIDKQRAKASKHRRQTRGAKHAMQRAADARRAAMPPTPDELEVREIVKDFRKEAKHDSRERPLVAPLAVAARRAAEILCERTPGLDDDEHREAVANYLTERLGDVLDGFDVIAYRDWREACVADLALRDKQER